MSPLPPISIASPAASAVLGAANELAAAPAPGQWLKLADYGDWPHPAGLQRFNQASAAEMVRGFQSLWGRLRRKFGGVPLYVGHPDDPGFAGQAGHDDTRAYAWIMSLEARPDGLYILPQWSEPGRELLRHAFYKFLSPRWQMQPLGHNVFAPVRLLSVGLTNHPNIPGEAIANQQPAMSAPAVVLPGPAGVASEAPHIASCLPAANATPLTAHLATRRPATVRVADADRFLALVNARRARTGESYATAFARAKREHAVLFNS